MTKQASWGGHAKKFLNSRPSAVFLYLGDDELLLRKIVQKSDSMNISVSVQKKNFVFITDTCFSFWLLNWKHEIKIPKYHMTPTKCPGGFWSVAAVAWCEASGPTPGALRGYWCLHLASWVSQQLFQARALANPPFHHRGIQRWSWILCASLQVLAGPHLASSLIGSFYFESSACLHQWAEGCRNQLCSWEELSRCASMPDLGLAWGTWSSWFSDGFLEGNQSDLFSIFLTHRVHACIHRSKVVYKWTKNLSSFLGGKKASSCHIRKHPYSARRCGGN